MPAPQLVPDKTTLQAWIREGLTHKQMAQRVFETTGHKIGRTAISNAMIRYGLATERPRYTETLPWKVKTGYATHYAARMLRLLGRRDNGGTLNELEDQRLDAWLEMLRKERAVVAYDAETGFHYVDKGLKDHRTSAPIRRKEIHLSRA